MAIVKNDEIISNDIEIAKNFLSSFVKNLNIQRDETHFSEIPKIIQFYRALKESQFSKNPSIISIKKHLKTTSNKFSFK